MEISRRNFLKLLLAMGIGSSVTSYARQPLETRKTRIMMGTYVTISVMDRDREKALSAIAEAYREMDRVIMLLSRYDATSQVSRLNTSGVLINPAPELVEVLRRALYYSRVSEGAFDVTIAPLLDLYRKAFSTGRPPSSEDIKEKLALIDYRNIAVGEGMIYFTKKETQITLDGIAKGYIVDRAAEALWERDISHALIDAGGDIRAIGGKSNSASWRVGIRDPARKDAVVAYYPLRDGSIATSGGYEVYFDKARLYTHIINPRTGYSPGFSLSATAAAKTCMDADALSTTCFTMEEKDALALLRRLGAHGLIVTGEGISLGRGFKKVIT